ncbi:hypothetical protein LSTR_LSTR012574 [Laodelphax striatellus]|uniref:MADF domain-containing protein n=1 Tax=Laodelphax striatellus TaxID=195883 RepID=A0A482WUY9_LAOST|nr:hypothetical protein LSTR_LSTR012574 [Laodelphax striatellus]
MSFSLCDEIKLISLIAENPCLHDSTDKDFNSGYWRTAAWQQISRQLNKRADICKSVWTKIRRSYNDALRNSRLGIGTPASWKSKHHELMSSLYAGHQKGKPKPTIESIYASDNSPLDNKLEVEDLQQNSSRIEWVDCDLNVVEPPSSGFEENGGPGGQSLQIAENGLTVQPSVAVGPRVSQGMEKAGKRSSDRVRQKVDTSDSVDNDIVAEILREEQKLLQQYHRQQKNSAQKIGGGEGRNSDVSAKKRRVPSKKRPVSAKKRQVSNTAQKVGKNEAAKVEVEGTQVRNSRVANRSSRLSKDGGMQGTEGGGSLKLNRGSQQNSSHGGNNAVLGSPDQQNSSHGRRNLRLGSSDQHNSSHNVGLGSSDRIENNLRLGSHDEQSLHESHVTNNNFDDVDLFCRHIGSVLRSLNPLQKAVAKKDLSSVLSHYEIVAAKNAVEDTQRCAGLENTAGYNMVTTTRMEGVSLLGASPRLSFVGGQM